MEDKKYFDILQIFRGIAAFLVVIHHSYASFEYFHGLDIPFLKFLASVGKLGVDFFFVLSGFIITYTTFKHRNSSHYFKKYISNRLIRIYTPYLPISIALILLYAIFPSFSDSDREISLLTSLTLIPDGNPALSVAWTLTFEMFFYLIYSVNFFSKKGWYYLLAIWIIGILLFNFSGLLSENAFINLLFNLYNLEFIIGVVVAYLVLSHCSSNYRILLVSAVATLVLFLLFKYFDTKPFPFFQNYLFCISAGIFVYIGVKFWNFKINKTNLLMLIGNSSYSLYLLHNPLQSFLVRIFPKWENQLLILMAFFIVVVLCCLVSYLYFLVFERMLINRIKKKLVI